MMDKKLVFCIAQYENRSFLGALFYLYRIVNNLSMDQLLENVGLSKNQRKFLQNIEKSPKITNNKLKAIIDYFNITDEELNSYPNVNVKGTGTIFKIVEKQKDNVLLMNWEILKELEINPATFYKYKKYASQIELISEEEAINYFADLYFKEKKYPLRNSYFYVFMLKNNITKAIISKTLNTSSEMINRVVIGETTRGTKRIELKLCDLYGDKMKFILSTYE